MREAADSRRLNQKKKPSYIQLKIFKVVVTKYYT